MGRLRRKRTGAKNKAYKKSRRTKRRTKDLDQIHEDLLDERQHVQQHAERPPRDLDPDLPGLGQFYCAACTRYFLNEEVLKRHFKSKKHKKNLKRGMETPHTQADANAAAGMGAPDNGRDNVARPQDDVEMMDTSL